MRQDHLIYPDVTILMDPWLQDAGTGFSAKALKEEKEAFYKRQKAAENKAAQLESYLANVLDGEKVKETEFSIGWRKSKAVTITDEKKLPETFLIAQPPKVDKTAIGKALKGGEDVPGAELEERVNIQIK